MTTIKLIIGMTTIKLILDCKRFTEDLSRYRASYLRLKNGCKPGRLIYLNPRIIYKA